MTNAFNVGDRVRLKKDNQILERFHGLTGIVLEVGESDRMRIRLDDGQSQPPAPSGSTSYFVDAGSVNRIESPPGMREAPEGDRLVGWTREDSAELTKRLEAKSVGEAARATVPHDGPEVTALAKWLGMVTSGYRYGLPRDVESVCSVALRSLNEYDERLAVRMNDLEAATASSHDWEKRYGEMRSDRDARARVETQILAENAQLRRAIEATERKAKR